MAPKKDISPYIPLLINMFLVFLPFVFGNWWKPHLFIIWLLAIWQVAFWIKKIVEAHKSSPTSHIDESKKAEDVQQPKSVQPSGESETERETTEQ